jgi:hypothetical protein
LNNNDIIVVVLVLTSVGVDHPARLQKWRRQAVNPVLVRPALTVVVVVLEHPNVMEPPIEDGCHGHHPVYHQQAERELTTPLNSPWLFLFLSGDS